MIFLDSPSFFDMHNSPKKFFAKQKKEMIREFCLTPPSSVSHLMSFWLARCFAGMDASDWDTFQESS
jgi:hypothetical protein